MDEDPYESIITRCQITSSQEEKLRKCPSFPQPEKGEISQCSVQPTGIVMVSPPESFKDQLSPHGEEEEEEEAFHTPPEHPRSQSISSSEDQGPAIGVQNPQEFQKKDCGADIEMLDVDIGCKVAERTVDLGEDSDTLVFSEPNLVKEFDGGDGIINLEYGEPISKKNRVSKECLQSESPNVNLGDTEPIVIENESIEIGATEVNDLEFEENCEEWGELLTENTVNADKRVKETEVGCGGVNSDNAGANGGEHLASKNIEDLDKFKYVPCGGTDKCGMERGGRELLHSFREPKKKEGLWVPRVSSRNKKAFKDLFDAVGIIVNDSKATDFLETAKERGIIFPRPRWWPPEGFGGQGLD